MRTATGTADGTTQVHVVQYLPGVYVATTEAGQVRRPVETGLPWDGVVHVDVLSVPYFAWGNRAVAAMRVWVAPA